MSDRTFYKYSTVRCVKEHRTLGIPEGKLLVVSSPASKRPMFTAFGIDARLKKENFVEIAPPVTAGDRAYCINPTSTLTMGKEYILNRGVFVGEVSVMNDKNERTLVLRSRFSLTKP